MRSTVWIILLIVSAGWTIGCVAQDTGWPVPPSMKGYQGNPGKVAKYNNFNYLDVRDEAGEKFREAMGNYWEISYLYDSVFRQKRKFKEFMVAQINEREGRIFFQDTTQLHFVLPEEGGNIWGRLVLVNDKAYRLRLIKEGPFNNKLRFDQPPSVRYESFVDTLALPPRINYLPSSWITRAQFSKFNHQEYTWNVKDTLVRQKVMGPYWEFKLEVRNSSGEVDRTISSVEILESYYRACSQAGGTIIRNRPRELLFVLSLEQAALWCRLSVSLDGVYFIRAVRMEERDRTEPVKTVVIPPEYTDSVPDDMPPPIRENH